jgi:hypothetical protein
MPEFGTAPVGTNVNPVGRGMQTLSDVMNVKRSQQALQTGVYQQQTAQANASQDQQKNQELQSLAQFTKQAASDPAYHNPDGSLNVQKYQTDAMKAAPTYGQAYIGQMTNNANAMVDNRKALLSLSNEQRSTIGNYFGAVAAKPGATREDFLSAAEQARGVSDDPGYQKAVDRMLMGAPDVRTLPTAQAAAAIQQHARGIAMETGAPDAAQSSPSVSMVQGPQGLVPTNVNPQAPGGIQPVGPTQAQGIAPQIVTQPGTQNPAVVGGSQGTVPKPIGPPAAQGAPGQNPWQLPIGGVEAARGAAAGVTERVQQAQAAANNTTQAQDALNRTRAILDKPDAINSGTGFEWKKSVRNVLASAGINTGEADDANTLVKNLSRYEAARATQAGLGGTDAARELAHNGSPNVSLSTDALKGVVTQSLATEKALAAYAGIQSKTRDPGALAKNEADFRNIPNLIEGYEYGLARTPQEADAFLKKHGVTKADMARTRQQIKEFESR